MLENLQACFLSISVETQYRNAVHFQKMSKINFNTQKFPWEMHQNNKTLNITHCAEHQMEFLFVLLQNCIGYAAIAIRVFYKYTVYCLEKEKRRENWSCCRFSLQIEIFMTLILTRAEPFQYTVLPKKVPSCLLVCGIGSEYRDSPDSTVFGEILNRVNWKPC